MTRFSLNLIAKLAAAMLLLIVIRALGEVFRLEYLHTDVLAYSEIRPMIVGALAAALTLAATLLAIQLARPGMAIALACIAAGALFIYRVYFVV